MRLALSSRNRGFEISAHKLPHLETYRGLACVLIVLFHVTLGLNLNGPEGLRLASDSFYLRFGEILLPIRLALFTFISGHVYALKPCAEGRRGAFLQHKARRLLVPFLVLNPLFLLLEAGTIPAAWPTLADVVRLYREPFWHLWYLPALACIFALLVLLELGSCLRKPATALAFLAVSLGLVVWLAGKPGDIPGPFALRGALYLLPFFVLGVLWQRHETLLTGPRLRLVLPAVLVGVHFLASPYLAGGSYASLPSLLVSVLALVTLFQFRPRLRWLMWIGSYSFTIFLLHPLLVAPVRTLLARVHPPVPVAIFSLVLAGLFGPIVLLESFHWFLRHLRLVGKTRWRWCWDYAVLVIGGGLRPVVELPAAIGAGVDGPSTKVPTERTL